MVPIKREYTDIFCDLYGTIFDIRTQEDSPDVWNMMCDYMNARGARFEDGQTLYALYQTQWEQAYEEGVRERGEYVEVDVSPVWQMLYAHGGVQVDERSAAATATYFHQISMPLLQPYPHAREFLAIMRRVGIHPILVSNAQAAYTRPDLQAHRLTELFDAIFLSSDFGVKKPDKRFFDHALVSCNANPSRVLYLGNEIGCDVLGARGAGMDVVYLHTPLSVPGDPATSKDATLNVEGADYEAVLSWLCDQPVRIEGDGTAARIVPA
ncbi:HAD family hydrolase [Alloscardovia omnicolens]|uniref:HAD family hydrolase n=1 Tax=Alloscardovia omnicolens TaxID=419015 RepID=UPI003A710A96